MVRSEKAAWWRWPGVGVIIGSPQSLAPCAGCQGGNTRKLASESLPVHPTASPLPLWPHHILTPPTLSLR